MHGKYTNDQLSVPPNMLDDDKDDGVEAQFDSGKSIKEGVSGMKKIDTLFENFTQDTVDNPRSGITAPVDLDLYPHRGQ